MREFFKKELTTLYAKYQLKQYETLSGMVDEKGKKVGPEMITALLNELERVCDRFPFIPDQAKKNIVMDQMSTDPEFMGLNGRILHKWFDLNKSIYWTQEQSKKEEPISPPVDFTDLPEKLQNEIEAFKRSLLDSKGIKNVPGVTEKEIDGIRKEDNDRIKPKSYSKGYTPPPAEVIEDKEIHLEYIRQNYDIFGERKEGWMSEEQWRLEKELD